MLSGSIWAMLGVAMGVGRVLSILRHDVYTGRLRRRNSKHIDIDTTVNA